MPVEHVSLCRCRVLYLGSAIPLETAVGIESIQMPCRERYDNVDSDQKASGIDSSLSVYSSGIMLQYAADPSSGTWFPIQTLHVCAAVKAVGGSGPLRFVSLDTAAAQQSSAPPLFACIMRRTKGIKVLECHIFVCKSSQAAMALVQSCTHAFEHKEGWMGDSMPSMGTRIIPASKSSSGIKSVRGGGFYADRSDLVQKFDVSCKIGDAPKNPVPAPVVQPAMPQMMMVPMNPPGAPVMPMMQQAVQNEYFADWNMYGGQPLMIIPDSPFYPGDGVIQKKKKKKPKKKKKTTKVAEESSEEEETIFVKRSELEGRANMGDSLRSRIKGRSYGVKIEEIVEPAPPPVIVQPPKPAPPQIVIIAQPPPAPASAAPQPGPNAKSQQNPTTDVVVYAPQVIEANKDVKSYNYEHADENVMDYHPDNRTWRLNNQRYMYDGRADNRVNYNRQNYQKDDFRADDRQWSNMEDNRRSDYYADNRSNREDNRRYDYRADNRSNREDNRRMDYRADNRSNRMSNKAMGVYGMYDPEQYYDYGAQDQQVQDQQFEQGYADAQYEAQLAEYNRQLQEYYADEDGGYCPEEGCYPQPGYTDDYGVGDYVRHLPADDGRYKLDYVDDYVTEYGPPNGVGARQNFAQVADGLGYYP